MLRIALFFSLFAAIASGAWATFRDPTPENAAAIINPTTEQVAEAQGWVTPFFEWITGLTPASIGQLVDDAISDIKASLGDDPIVPPRQPKQSAGPSVRSPDGSSYDQHSRPSGSPTALPGSAEEHQQPGIDWYRAKK